MIVNNPLISTAWLHENLDQPNLVVIDCSWYLPVHDRNAKNEYELGHIKGAQFLDFEGISDKVSHLPHMLPKAVDFAKSVEAIGVSDNSLIVLYDGMGVFSSPRMWWMFLIFGAKNIRILNGGLPAWKAMGYKTTTLVKHPHAAQFSAVLNENLLAEMNDIYTAIKKGNQIIDARPSGRFSGRDPEPRAGLESGHMPGAINLPQSELVKNGYFLEGSDLSAAFVKAKINRNIPVVTTCGSGVTAASLTLGLAVLNEPIGKLYDGSWAEWASHSSNKIVKSEN